MAKTQNSHLNSICYVTFFYNELCVCVCVDLGDNAVKFKIRLRLTLNNITS